MMSQPGWRLAWLLPQHNTGQAKASLLSAQVVVTDLLRSVEKGDRDQSRRYPDGYANTRRSLEPITHTERKAVKSGGNVIAELCERCGVV